MIGPTRSRSLYFFQINPVKKRKADTEVLVVSVSMHIFELFGNQGGSLGSCQNCLVSSGLL